MHSTVEYFLRDVHWYNVGYTSGWHTTVQIQDMVKRSGGGLKEVMHFISRLHESILGSL